MSRLAKRPIIIPDKVKCELKDEKIYVTGPLGGLNIKSIPQVDIEIVDDRINIKTDSESRENKIRKGLAWSLIRNMIVGVTEGYKKNLEIRGVGYNAELVDRNLILKLGFTHSVEYKIPVGINISVEQKGVLITVKGIDKQLVGEVSAQIRRIKPPEHYKGTGIRYVDEYVIKKAGKAAIGAGTGAAAGTSGKK